MIRVPASYKRRRNRRARERALMMAASKLFASRGFESTTTREIAGLAGCAEGLIHRYFESKAGLLLALIKLRVSQEVVDLNQRLKLAPSLAEEIRQLVNWEVDRMWEDREFLRVIIPRALVNPTLGRMVSRIAPLQHTRAICERLRKFKAGRNLSVQEVEALAHFVSVAGFMFGFMRPVVLRHGRSQAKKVALTIARILAQNFPPAHPSRNGLRTRRNP